MKTLFITAAFAAMSLSATAQKKYEKMAYTDTETQHESVGIKAKDIVATKEYVKFFFKIDNKSDQIIIFKPEESTLRPEGGKEYKPDEKWILAEPGETGSRVINIKGQGLQIPSYSYQVDGLYRVSTTDQMVAAPDFALPASTNSFKAGSFDCTMLNLSKETDKTSVKFDCRYTGDKIGVIVPNRAAVKLPDGSEIANEKGKNKIYVLKKGESEKLTLVWNRMDGGKATDMQKINMQIQWRNSFVEAEQLKIPPVNLQFKLDEAASK